MPLKCVPEVVIFKKKSQKQFDELLRHSIQTESFHFLKLLSLQEILREKCMQREKERERDNKSIVSLFFFQLEK